MKAGQRGSRSGSSAGSSARLSVSRLFLTMIAIMPQIGSLG
jgi:hypothetical protein